MTTFFDQETFNDCFNGGNFRKKRYKVGNEVQSMCLYTLSILWGIHILNFVRSLSSFLSSYEHKHVYAKKQHYRQNDVAMCANNIYGCVHLHICLLYKPNILMIQ